MSDSPSIFFGVTEFAIDLILLLRKHEQHDHEHNQRALRGHVEAEREAEDRNDDLVERNHEHVDHVAEEEPDTEMDEHQSGRLLPVSLFVGLTVGLSHGSVPSLQKPEPLCGTDEK